MAETVQNSLNSSKETNNTDDSVQQASAVDTIYDRTWSAKPTTAIQPIEPVIGLTPEEQHKRKEDPKLTLTELLGLTLCAAHAQTLLQTLDSLYINQPTRFLPLAQEAKKLAKQLKEEHEASK